MKKVCYILILITTISCKEQEKKMHLLAIKYQEIGLQYLMENKSDSAIIYFKKALKINPVDITSYESLIKTYWRIDQPQKAFEFLENLPKELQKNISLLIFKGMTLEKLNKMDEAIKLYKTAFNESHTIRYINKKNVMEFVGYLILQTIIGEKEQALVEFEKLKSKKLTESEKLYIKSIEPLLRNYNDGGYNSIFGN